MIPFLEKLTDSERIDYLERKYPNIPDEIIKYVFNRHYSAVQMFNEFQDIDLTKCTFHEMLFTTEEVFSTIQYADFCCFRNETKNYYETAMKNNLENNNITNGTWNAPILITRVDQYYKTIDGNNRLRMLRCYLKWSNNYKLETHKAIVLENRQ